jgi:metallo-beta-lactamase family protein
MLLDSAHIQEKDAEHLMRHGKACAEPLYGQRDVAQTISQMNTVPYERSFSVAPGVDARFYDAGHILGSASVMLQLTENSTTRRLVFSGDIGRCGLAIIRDPHPPVGADAIIMESTYGNRDHSSVDGARARLGAIVRETAARGGRILIPSFAVGRTQELVYDLHTLARSGDIPRIPVFIDSPLASSATAVFELHPDMFDLTEDLIQQVQTIFRFDLVHFTQSVSESKALNTMHGPMVIIAASGMAESGRILHHLAHGASDQRNTILIVGFQAEHTLGRRIVERQPVIKVFGEEIPLRAQVEVLNGYSAHADRQELLRWIRTVRGDSGKSPAIYLVHGEADAQDAFAGTLRSDGFQVSIPTRGDRMTL